MVGWALCSFQTFYLRTPISKIRKRGREAADQGFAGAQSALGLMYEYGKGVKKAGSEAYKWYLLAGAQGHELGKKNIKEIERDLTAAQRAEGQRLAGEWKPKR